ncbi:MAG TPA: class II fructose-bisphosphate aldolase [Chloroflexota bacterium]|nr:class II fructose-bisphosphate aldolase [Chloroflexota bacterium]
MLVATTTLLRQAQADGFAIGAFNIYNLEGARAVVAAAEEARGPAILQVHPAALRHGGAPLLALCLAAAREAGGPIGVHLDHSASRDDILAALDAGVSSIMADGSHLTYTENLAFTREMAVLAHGRGAAVEAELGRLTGTEDDTTVAEHMARLTDPARAADFVARTEVDALAVCIGNVHGPYRGEPRLDFPRLAAIREVVTVPLVLHGASGLPDPLVRRAFASGVCKLNVNTEPRAAYMDALRLALRDGESPDLLEVMERATSAMQAALSAKLPLFGSAGRVPLTG